jgi:uracil-DNA glycosylase
MVKAHPIFQNQLPLESSWQAVLADQLAQPYMQELKRYLQLQAHKKIFPAPQNIFKAFELTPYPEVRVVILGQDPYHGLGQAHGLCFSVLPGVRLPPSLVNIYKELQADLGISPAQHGCLVTWAKQGVLLLNSVLTVEMAKAASHQGQGWEHFTDAVITKLNAHPRRLAFLLWGAYAQKKGKIIDTERHFVIKTAHPSPLSAHRGFWGSRPFSKINHWLSQIAEPPINWQLPQEAELDSSILY